MQYIKQHSFYLLFYIISLLLCFVAFKQGDLSHTYTSSYAYLNGHFYDFYEYNKIYMGGNDYLPIIYGIFALWGLPLKLLGLLSLVEGGGSAWQFSTPIEIFWFKVLVAGFFFACVILVGKISKLIEPKRLESSVSPALLFASSPISLFAVFIFSQYDVIGTFFTLLGIYAYFQKRFYRFAIFFSIAISFKYFAAVIYLPLVLIIEKRPVNLIKYGVIGLLATLIQIGAYWHSEIFQASFLALATRKTGEGIRHSHPIYLAILYVALCIYAYFSKIKLSLENNSWALNVIIVCILAYSFFFSFVNWHPQWILILMPFFALIIPYIRHQKVFIYLEIFGYVTFIWLCVNWFPGNVDVTMIKYGIVAPYTPALTYFGASVLPHINIMVATTAFYIYLYSPSAFLVYENWVLIRQAISTHFKRWLSHAPLELKQPDADTLQDFVKKDSVNYWRLYGLRVLVTCYLFLGMTAICFYRSSL